MSVVEIVENEAKKVEGEVSTEVTNVETKVENTVAEVETKTEGEVKAVEAEVKKFATDARIAITDAENLLLVKMENEFLKVQMELKRLGDQAKTIQEQYPKQVAALVKKYTIDEATHVFNAIEGAFVKKQ